MKRKKSSFIIFILIIINLTFSNTNVSATTYTKGISNNGNLTVKDSFLYNESDELFQITGMSSHGIQWFSQYTNTYSINKTKEYGANAYRIAMYTDQHGYIDNKDTIKTLAYTAIDNTLSLDMYAIIDWHILFDNNPLDHLEDAKIFFNEISEKYKNNPGLIYEICNEPNGNTSWEEIRKYANEIIPIIRKNSPKSLIIVGTPNYSSSIEDISSSPLLFNNIMYSYHFYTNSNNNIKDKITIAINKGIPIFISEWGTSSYDGSNGNDLYKSELLLNYINKKRISWCNWSLCNKDESSAALKTYADKENWIFDDLTESGQLVFTKF